MSTMTDTLAEMIRDSITDVDASRTEWHQALDQVFNEYVFAGDILDPLEPAHGIAEYPVSWEIDWDGTSPADAAAQVWREVFCRGSWQPNNEEACVFIVTDTNTGRQVEIDLSEERFAHLFPR